MDQNKIKKKKHLEEHPTGRACVSGTISALTVMVSLFFLHRRRACVCVPVIALRHW